MKRFCLLPAMLLTVCMAFSVASCSMMEEDRSDCPTGLYVRFVYDYNTQRADMFKDHVGCVVVYVYDEAGHLVAEKSVSNTQAASPLAQYGYAMHFTTAELPAGHTYQLQAVAMQKDYSKALDTPGAKYRLSDTDTYGKLRMTLDREPASDPTQDAPCLVSNSAPLDTLWHSMKVTSLEPQFGYHTPAMQPTAQPYHTTPDRQAVTVREGYATYATLSMMRDTKHLNITIRQIEEPDVLNADDYEVYILDANNSLGLDQTSMDKDGALHYTPAIAGDSVRYIPYAQWTTCYDGTGSTVEGGTHPATRAAQEAERTAHYNLMFNRLKYPSQGEGQATLVIRNLTTGITVARIGLASFLAECRISPEWNWTAQEYLDREYDYELNFFLKGDRWSYCSIRVHILNWAVRKQNVEL